MACRPKLEYLPQSSSIIYFVPRRNMVITYGNRHSVERLVIAVDWVDHHRTGYWSDVMNSEPHYVIGWISRSPVSIQNEVVIVEVAILRGGVTSYDQPRKCARYGSAHETGVEEYNVLSIISNVVPSHRQGIPGVYGCDIVIGRVSYAANYISIKLKNEEIPVV